MASDSGGGGSGSYRGWLGGYAKSMAGSVSAFTADILEETRADSTGKITGDLERNRRVVPCNTRIDTVKFSCSTQGEHIKRIEIHTCRSNCRFLYLAITKTLSDTHAELLAVSSKLEKKDSKIKSLEGEVNHPFITSSFQ